MLISLSTTLIYTAKLVGFIQSPFVRRLLNDSTHCSIFGYTGFICMSSLITMASSSIRRR